MIDSVFDTNIYLQSALSDTGAAFACWQLVENGEVRVFVSEAILAEIEDVLTRPKLREKYPVLTDEKVTEVLRAIRAHAVIIEEIQHFHTFERDADDEVFINLALTREAEFLVSRDKDLLDLQKNESFKNEFPDLKILNPAEFLQFVREAKNL